MKRQTRPRQGAGPMLYDSIMMNKWMHSYDTPITQLPLVVFDTETSGAWPIANDIVEFGAVKWFEGKIIDELQILIKPREPMSAFNISIHGITNEMVAEAPVAKEVYPRILNFLNDSVAIAHHAPFDMGFVAATAEVNGFETPNSPVLCTSLLARKLIHETPNHKLQTLVSHFQIDGGAAHRALDDAKSCLQVALKCFERKDSNCTLKDLITTQGRSLEWKDYLTFSNADPLYQTLIQAILKKNRIQFLYDKSSVARQALPQGLIRNPDGDFMQALCLRDRSSKRFYLAKMSEVHSLPGDDFQID